MEILRFDHTPGPRPPVVGPYLPKKVYRDMLTFMPLVNIDMVVVHGNKFLLVRRAKKPELGKWFVPGGRVAKNETLTEAARRKLLEETGLKGSAPKLIAVAEHFNVKDYLPHDKSHFIAFIFLIKVKPKKSIDLDAQSSEARWFSKIPRGLHPYPRAILRIAGFH